MTQEEMEDERIANESWFNEDNGYRIMTSESTYNYAFKKGLKASRPEWHDIESHVLPKREISKKYMPKANEKVMLKYHFYNETEIHYSDGYYDMLDFEFHIPNNPTGRIICVIAWCELSQFKG